jgi:hypothetical protein
MKNAYEIVEIAKIHSGLSSSWWRRRRKKNAYLKAFLFLSMSFVFFQYGCHDWIASI